MKADERQNVNVLIISHMYPSIFNEVRGIFVLDQVRALFGKNVKIQVVSPVPWAPFPLNRLSQKWKAYSEIPVRAVWNDITVWYPRYLIFPRAWFFASSGKWMYRGIKNVVAKIYQEFRFDLIHAHVALPDGYAGVLLAQKYHKPLLVTIHGLDLYITLYRSKGCKNALIYVFDEANRIITVSNKLRKILEKELGYAEKIITISNGVSVNELGHVVRNKELRSNSNCRNLISVSYLIMRKGIEFNLRAFAELTIKYPNVKYTIIGDGPEKAHLEALASNLDKTNRVEFLGMLSHKEVLTHMAKADVFSLPSWNEAFGVVYIEAMAHGKPVVGCQGEGIEDFVEHGKTGMLVKPQDVDSLVDALDFLISHQEEANAMGQRARKHVLENYTWERNAEKTIKLYEEILHAN